MTQRTSLSELISQSRRISKEIDMLCNSTIDSVLCALPYLDKPFLYKNKEFFERFCTYYHKDNPLQMFKKIPKKKPHCFSCKDRNGVIRVFRKFVQSSIVRCEKGLHASSILFCEIIDLLWERPELCSPPLIESDSYLQMRIAEACDEFNKRNPLTDKDQRARLGRKWLDEGTETWQAERRRRF